MESGVAALGKANRKCKSFSAAMEGTIRRKRSLDSFLASQPAAETEEEQGQGPR